MDFWPMEVFRREIYTGQISTYTNGYKLSFQAINLVVWTRNRDGNAILDLENNSGSDFQLAIEVLLEK